MTTEQLLFIQGKNKKSAYTAICWICFFLLIPGIIFGFWPLLIIAWIIGVVIGVCGESQIEGSGIKEEVNWKRWWMFIVAGTIITILCFTFAAILANS